MSDLFCSQGKKFSSLAEKHLSSSGRFQASRKSFKSLIAASMTAYSNRKILLIVPEYTDLDHYDREIRWYLSHMERSDEKILLFPDRETFPYQESTPFRDLAHERNRALYFLAKDPSIRLLIATRRALLERVLPVKDLLDSVLIFAKGSRISFSDLEKHLHFLGYQREDFVEEPGTYQIRGEIVDIFSPLYPSPLRFDFFNDEIESIRFFDFSTQRSVEEIREAILIPVRDVLLSLNQDGLPVELKSYAESEGYFPGIENYLPLLHPDRAFPGDYLSGSEWTLVVDDQEEFEQRQILLQKEYDLLFEKSDQKWKNLPPSEFLMSLTEWEVFLKSGPLLDLCLFACGEKNQSVLCSDPPRYSGNIQRLRADLAEQVRYGYHPLVLSENAGTLLRLKDVLTDPGFPEVRDVVFDRSPVEEGFLCQDAGLFLVTDIDIYNKKSTYKRKQRTSTRDLFSFLELKHDDFIVHEDHGIGIFRNIVRLKAEDRMRDYILVEYRDADKLYVPLDQLNRIQKYIGQEGHKPELNKLGTANWESLKQRIKKSLRMFARELLELYSVRSHISGIAFQPDGDWQKQFELSFPYAETPDQMESIQKVKEDMEKARPMDRLICGDVGYGKTEVAMRAAFKAVMSGRQVAVLVPTTILAEQHYHTFLKRFAAFPVHIEVLSRFRSRRDQERIIERMNRGKIDIIIGTHKLIFSRIRFPSLGLLVVDEEQKFGVMHKEKIKKMRSNIDVLTMSATPIPRTLNFSLSGIRDISVIETPPRDRLPISTQILPFQEGVVQAGICRELERKGQVFFVHNHVKSIDSVTRKLRDALPDVRIEAAHAQMTEGVLEEIMLEFYEQRIDVLVCTTIVESGLDLPNVNTIFINHAQNFGLSQLYQLKGRVGRSERRAYAYLLYPEDKPLTKIQKKRLATINEHTELGAGIKIAMRDLEIRGAGSFFGTKQHGNILSVGLDMYLRLLDSTVQELKGKKVRHHVETNLDLNYEAYIPDEYIRGLESKIYFYKEIMKCRTLKDLKSVKGELRDRFGRIPDEVASIFWIKEIKLQSRRCGISHIIEKKTVFELRFSRLDKPDEDRIRKIVEYIRQNPAEVGFDPMSPDSLFLNRKGEDAGPVFLLNFLKKLYEFIKL